MSSERDREKTSKQTCPMKSPIMKSAVMKKKKKNYRQGAEIENDRLALPSLGWSGAKCQEAVILGGREKEDRAQPVCGPVISDF